MRTKICTRSRDLNCWIFRACFTHWTFQQDFRPESYKRAKGGQLDMKALGRKLTDANNKTGVRLNMVREPPEHRVGRRGPSSGGSRS